MREAISREGRSLPPAEKGSECCGGDGADDGGWVERKMVLEAGEVGPTADGGEAAGEGMSGADRDRSRARRSGSPSTGDGRPSEAALQRVLTAWGCVRRLQRSDWWTEALSWDGTGMGWDATGQDGRRDAIGDWRWDRMGEGRDGIGGLQRWPVGRGLVADARLGQED